jgi:peptidoglycan/xylan/chitin deacetylase (PgdA/CDA1 family)
MRFAETVKIPILTYHSIDESGSVISVSREIFRQQMDFLGANGYKTVSLGNLADSLLEKKALSPKTVVLTFDDGFENFYTAAYPILEQHDFRATVFLVTDLCDCYNSWDKNSSNVAREKLLSWRQIKELKANGIEFGAHTKTHPDLTKISAAEVEVETIESKAMIENMLGSEVTTFAYPYGKFNPAVKRAVAENFKAACSTNLGKIKQSSDLFSLERIDAYYLSNPKIFKSLSSPAFDQYLRLRQAMRDFKTVISQN